MHLGVVAGQTDLTVASGGSRRIEGSVEDDHKAWAFGGVILLELEQRAHGGVTFAGAISVRNSDHDVSDFGIGHDLQGDTGSDFFHAGTEIVQALVGSMEELAHLGVSRASG